MTAESSRMNVMNHLPDHHGSRVVNLFSRRIRRDDHACRSSRIRILRPARYSSLVIMLSSILYLGCGTRPVADLEPGSRLGNLDAWVSVSQDSTGAAQPLVVVSAPYRQLVFVKDGDSFTAGLEVRVLAWRDEFPAGGGVARDSVSLEHHAATGSSTRFEVSVPLLVRGDDPVSLEVSAQVLGTTRIWRRFLSYAPKTLVSMPIWISDLDIDMGTSPDGELLSSAGGDSLRLTVALIHQNNGPDWPDGGIDLISEIDAVSLAQPRRKRTAVPLRVDSLTTFTMQHAWPLDRLPFGRFQVRMILEAEQEGRRWQLPREPALSLVNLSVPHQQDRAWRRHLVWMEGLLSTQIRDSLKMIDPEVREEAWVEAWRRIGAEGDLDPSFAERRHLRRIVTADDRFGGFGRGALSDRGRVFIRRGEPAQIEEYVDNRVPGAVFEIWIYPAAGMRFIFYDAHGNGDFRLRQSEPIAR
jgi:GWxTD domain-containing protein